ncbi:hypothetical protein D7V97_22075 [Corallococcus sp. CA053C]|uniref:AHH domain-containing protein n=1 Tax=Corallococcus sp. CA053C TaxID=2316732 RepID=UPI000EA3E7E9|nr:AHH domain-containing protein [Corallococcus sp. CA053C]RKH06840.1 hypothetical protein D7V97_22075 [Corallococcus sp. CA053C]
MNARRWIPLLLLLLVGCGTSSRAFRLETGQGDPIAYVPPSGIKPVKLEGSGFKEAVHQLGRDATYLGPPREAALRLFAQSLRPRTYSHVRGRLGLVSVESPERAHLLEPDASSELTSAYTRWCKRKGTPGDCLRLLDDGPSLDEEGRRTLAFQIALDSVWNETVDALGALTHQDEIVAMLATTGAVYFGLWLLPEPVSKGIAAVLTVSLIAYLGWDTVWGLIQGFQALAAQVRMATTFDEIRGAGEAYGKVMGKNAARVFVMLAMAALGETAQTLAARLPTLPGSAQAALLGAEQGGFRLSAAGQVTSVEMAPGGVITIALAPGAVAQTARETSASRTEGVDAKGHEHHIASNKFEKATHSGGPWTPRFRQLFEKAGMSLDDPANKVRVRGHKGPHPQEYHEEIFERLRDATRDCDSMRQCRELLVNILEKLAKEINTQNTLLNKLVTRTD